MELEVLTVMSLHALEYCKRLFYLEEVEGIKVANDRVYAGRTLHLEAFPDEPDVKEIRSFDMGSEKLGLSGTVDAIKKNGGQWIPYELKKGRPNKTAQGYQPWPADEIQVGAYGLLLEEHLGQRINLGKVHYHEANITLPIEINATLRQRVNDAIKEARDLQTYIRRPPVTEQDRKCLSCSLASECLPEEERKSKDLNWQPIRLFPEERSGSVVHLVGHDFKLRKSGNTFIIEKSGQESTCYPIGDVSGFVIHGYGQITTQALHLCASEGIKVHWLSSSGRHLGSLSSGVSRVQRRIRQFKALTDQDVCLRLTKALVTAKVESQLKYILRATRGKERSELMREVLKTIRFCLKSISSASNIASVRGLEGLAARQYFAILPNLLKDKAAPELYPNGRNRRPPTDRFNALLSFGYSLLYQSVLSAILTVGLEPAFGFYHQPRSSGHPLVLDIMELFRLSVWDVALIGSINRGQWDPQSDFAVTNNSVWLSKTGKTKAIQLYEDRLNSSWKHPVTNYSLSYERIIELEVRLVEKEWSGQADLFAKARLR